MNAKLYDAIKLAQKVGCPNGKEHFIRTELSPDVSEAHLFCTDCQWETLIKESELDHIPERVQEEEQQQIVVNTILEEMDLYEEELGNIIGDWISKRRGTQWELKKLAREIRVELDAHVEDAYPIALESLKNLRRKLK